MRRERHQIAAPAPLLPGKKSGVERRGDSPQSSVPNTLSYSSVIVA